MFHDLDMALSMDKSNETGPRSLGSLDAPEADREIRRCLTDSACVCVFTVYLRISLYR